MEPGLKMPSLKEDYHVISDVQNYRRLIGKLFYLSNATRPDISFAVSFLSRFASKPGQIHLQAAKRILRYLKGSENEGLVYTSFGHEKNATIVCYSDADWGGDPTDRKSTTGFLVYLGHNLLAWTSKKQQVVALSTMEAEYIAVAKTVQELQWFQKLYKELPIQLDRTILFCDNKSSIEFSKNQDLSERSKHIDIKYFFVRDHLETNETKLNHVPSEQMHADVLTKALPAAPFQQHRFHLFHGRSVSGLQGEFVEVNP